MWLGNRCRTCVKGLPDEATPKGGAHADAQAPEAEPPCGQVRLRRAVWQLQQSFRPRNVQERALSCHAPPHCPLQAPTARSHTLSGVSVKEPVRNSACCTQRGSALTARTLLDPLQAQLQQKGSNTTHQSYSICSHHSLPLDGSVLWNCFRCAGHGQPTALLRRT